MWLTTAQSDRLRVLLEVSPDDRCYQRAARIADAVLAGEIPTLPPRQRPFLIQKWLGSGVVVIAAGERSWADDWQAALLRGMRPAARPCTLRQGQGHPHERGRRGAEATTSAFSCYPAHALYRRSNSPNENCPANKKPQCMGLAAIGRSLTPYLK